MCLYEHFDAERWTEDDVVIIGVEGDQEIRPETYPFLYMRGLAKSTSERDYMTSTETCLTRDESHNGILNMI